MYCFIIVRLEIILWLVMGNVLMFLLAWCMRGRAAGGLRRLTRRNDRRLTDEDDGRHFLSSVIRQGSRLSAAPERRQGKERKRRERESASERERERERRGEKKSSRKQKCKEGERQVAKEALDAVGRPLDRQRKSKRVGKSKCVK